jgi:hypothetical protein
VNAPRLRPLGIGEILDVALKIYWRNLGTLFRIVLFVVAPVQVLSNLITVSALPNDAFSSSSSEINGGDVATSLTGFVVVTLLSFVASSLATAACFKGVADAYLGERANWRTSLRYSARRLASVLWILVLGGVLTILGLVFCIVPGVYLYAAFAVALPVLMTEGLRGSKALSRSRDLVGGRWWPTFAIVILGSILASIVGFVFGLLLAVASLANAGGVTAFVFGTLSGTLTAMITTPFKAAYTVVLYVDLRVRKEAFDLQLLARQIGVDLPEGAERPPLAPPPPPQFGGKEPPYWPPPPGWKPAEEE